MDIVTEQERDGTHDESPRITATSPEHLDDEAEYLYAQERADYA